MIKIDPPLDFVEDATIKSRSFAIDCSATVHETYKKRNPDQLLEQTQFQLYYSKLSEFYVSWFLNRISPRLKCTSPDITIYDSLKKSFDADLYCFAVSKTDNVKQDSKENKVAIHVKCCPSNRPPSWNGQWGGKSGKGSDPHLFSVSDSNDFVAFVQYIDHPTCFMNNNNNNNKLEFNLHGLVKVQTILENNLWQLPQKQTLHDNKRFVYVSHSSGSDLQHLSTLKRFDTQSLQTVCSAISIV